MSYEYSEDNLIEQTANLLGKTAVV